MTHGLNQVAAYRVAEMLETQANGIVKIGALLRHMVTLPDYVEQAILDNLMELADIVMTLDRIANEIS